MLVIGGAGARAAQARKRPGSAAATRKMVVDQVENKARINWRGRALAPPKEAAPKPTPFGALKALSGELGVPKRDRDQITTIVKAQILKGRAPTADRILEAHADLLRRHRADAIAAIKACKAREAIIQAAQAAAADCDGDQVSAVAPFAPKLEDVTRAVELSIREWRRRLARPAPFRYRGCLYGEVVAHERVVFDKAANATDDAQDEVVRWLLRRDAAGGPAEEEDEGYVEPAWDLLERAMAGDIIEAGDERRLRATYEAERALFAERGEAPPPLLTGWGAAAADATLAPLLQPVELSAPAPAPRSVRRKKKKKRSRHDDDEPRKRHRSEAAPLPSLATYAPPQLYRDQVQSSNFQQALQRFTQPPPVPQKFGGHEQANYLRCGVCGADCSGEAAFKQHIASKKHRNRSRGLGFAGLAPNAAGAIPPLKDPELRREIGRAHV